MFACSSCFLLEVERSLHRAIADWALRRELYPTRALSQPLACIDLAAAAALVFCSSSATIIGETPAAPLLPHLLRVLRGDVEPGTPVICCAVAAFAAGSTDNASIELAIDGIAPIKMAPQVVVCQWCCALMLALCVRSLDPRFRGDDSTSSCG